jgi:hypothetical protein
MAAQPQAQGWHVAQWGFWGWLETAVKLVGIVAGLLAFVGALAADGFTIGGHPHLVAVILLALYSLFTIFVITLRVQQREVISVGFAVINSLGHLGALFALLRQPTLTTLPIILAVGHILGELIKQQFLRQSGYTESGRDSSAMLRISYVFMSAYAVLLVALVL